MSSAQHLIGAWHPVAASVSGRVLDVAEIQVAHLQFDAERYVIFDRGGQPVNQGPYQLKINSQPWMLDLNTESSAPSKSIAAICELGVDEAGTDLLTICYALEGAERPSSFAEAQDFSGPAETARLHLTLMFRRLPRS
ncbi:MAG: hypothetical protein EBR00_06080 [Gammaproteobacteria bacterium]|jgi:uncharacterized protein (TIGR03067 family)|nr:hypothetical protein [Gammaproteobacteria bacterium]